MSRFDSNTHYNYHPGVFRGATSRQYGAGLGSAVAFGVKNFVVPVAKKYGVPLAKNFLVSAAPEVLEVFGGRKKAKAAAKTVFRNTAKRQLGLGRSRSSNYSGYKRATGNSRRRITVGTTARNRTSTALKRKRSNTRKRTKRVTTSRVTKKATKTRRRSRASATASKSGRRYRNDFFTKLLKK